MVRRVSLLTTFAIVALVVLIVPALGSNAEDAIRLHLGSDGTPSFRYGATTQNLTTAKNGCQITSAEPLIDLASTNGGTSQPGLNALGLGVKSAGSNSNGTPCGQTDATETLSLASMLTGRSFNKVRLDVEMTGDAVVLVRFFVGSSTTASETATLQTGTSITDDQSNDLGYDMSAPYEVTTATYTSDTNGETDADLTDACAAPNSSGPNNGVNDNCLWTIDPGITFDRVTITTTVGTVSLEGSGDFGNDPAHDSLFYLANAVPVANDDTFSTDEDTTLQDNVLANDADADGDGLTVSLGQNVAHGNLTLSTNGSFTYVPTANYNGPDSFTYTVSDGKGGLDSATVTITVNAVNDRPTVNSPSVSTNEDTPVTIPIAQLGTDVEGDQLTVVIPPNSGPSKGTAVVNPDGSVTYTPDLNANGPDSFTFRVCEVVSQICSEGTATVNISVGSVNDPPVALSDDAYVDAGASVVVSGPVKPGDDDILDNDTDADGDSLTVTAVTQGDFGTVAIQGVTVTYTADLDFTGTDDFTYTVSDGNGGSATATVRVHELFQCGETLSISEGTVSATYERLFPEGSTVCGDDGKPYEVALDTSGDQPIVIFQPRSVDIQNVVDDCSLTPADCTDEFVGELTFEPKPKDNPPQTGTLQYDPRTSATLETAIWRDMQWCDVDPFAIAIRRAALPDGESWCIVSAHVTIHSPTETLTTWTVYGIGDPFKKA